MNVSVKRRCPHFTTYRAARVHSLFDCTEGHTFTVDVELPDLAAPWRLGLIVGPSGSGKTSIAAEAWPGVPITALDDGWPYDQPLIEAIAPSEDFDAVVAALQAAGLGSVPAWLRPFRVLSNGEKFRAGLARLLAAPPDVSIVDEFTSVIDRDVAQAASMAFAKALRRHASARAVLVSCHYDIIEWLQPDWLLDTATGKLDSCLRRERPPVRIEIARTSKANWPLFERHHYLKTKGGKLPPCHCYLASVRENPIGFVAVQTPWTTTTPHRLARIVVLPEWQGIGIGVRLACAVARLYPDMSINTRHPGFVRSLQRHGWIVAGRKLHGKLNLSTPRYEKLGACGVCLKFYRSPDTPAGDTGAACFSPTKSSLQTLSPPGLSEPPSGPALRGSGRRSIISPDATAPENGAGSLSPSASVSSPSPSGGDRLLCQAVRLLRRRSNPSRSVTDSLTRRPSTATSEGKSLAATS
jgi:GNAT superfamily N-acetyltransferase